MHIRKLGGGGEIARFVQRGQGKPSKACPTVMVMAYLWVGWGWLLSRWWWRNQCLVSKCSHPPHLLKISEFIRNIRRWQIAAASSLLNTSLSPSVLESSARCLWMQRTVLLRQPKSSR